MAKRILSVLSHPEYGNLEDSDIGLFASAFAPVAGHDDAGGKVELEVYNPQGADGKATQSILAFHDGEANFTVARKEMLAPKWITFDTMLDDAARSRQCDKKAGRQSGTHVFTHEKPPSRDCRLLVPTKAWFG